MANPPETKKQGLLQDLYETGVLDDYPFKFRVTAFLIAKGFRNPSEAIEGFCYECLGLKKFHPSIVMMFSEIFTERDFYIYQSVIESLLSKLLEKDFSDRVDLKIRLEANDTKIGFSSFENIWTRVNQVLVKLTPKQSEVVPLLFTGLPRLTYQEAAIQLGISIDSVRDREEAVIAKFQRAFPEFSGLFPYKDWSKNQKRFYIYDGLIHLASLEFVHPVKQIKYPVPKSSALNFEKGCQLVSEFETELKESTIDSCSE